MTYPHPILAREGWPFIASSVLLSVIVWALAGFWWSLPIWLLTIFVVQFFRDPARPIPRDPLAVLSPADGRIVAITHAFDPYAGRDALKISVFMNLFNAHSNRAPVDGALRDVQYFPGKFVNADLDKASEQNERNALVIDCDGRVVTAVQVAGLIARRILCYVKAGDALQRGQRFGFIRFGSRVDVYLPLDTQSRVSIGDKVYASSTVLADFAA